jgi:putative copper resistance protein D
MAITAAVQGWGLLGGLAGLFETAYGRIALAKLVLFGLLLGFAAINRLRFTPALTHADTRGARRRLHRSIRAETLAGLIVIVLAGVLLNLPPGKIMTSRVQPTIQAKWRRERMVDLDHGLHRLHE